MSYERINWKDYPDTDTPLNAENLNKMDEAIKNLDTNAETSLKDNGESFRFGYVNGQYGYYDSESKGADTFHPFKSAPVFEYLGTGGTYDIKALYPNLNYKELTLEKNFAIATCKTGGTDPYYAAGTRGGDATYDPETGILTVTNGELGGGKYASYYGSLDFKWYGVAYTKAWIIA